MSHYFSQSYYRIPLSISIVTMTVEPVPTLDALYWHWNRLGNLLRAEYTTPDGSGKDVKGDMSDRTVLYDGDGHMTVNGTLEMSRFEGGYFNADGKAFYYLTDYQGNVVRVIDKYGVSRQGMDYYPYGEPWQEWDWARADTNSYMIKNRFLYGGKERITQFGLGLYNFKARMYRAQLGRFSTPDKKAIDTPWLSPFAYCACNPVNAIDPDGNVVIFINGKNRRRFTSCRQALLEQ